MPILHSKKYNYLAYHFPKAGCTFLKRFFTHLHKEEDEELSDTIIPLLDVNTFQYIVYAVNMFKFDKSLRPNIKHAFCFTRHPYTRAVSMYTNKYIQRDIAERWAVRNLPRNLCFYNFLKEMTEQYYKSSDKPPAHYKPMSSCQHKWVDYVVLHSESGHEGLISHYNKYLPEIPECKVIDAIEWASKIPNKTVYGKEEGDATRINFYGVQPKDSPNGLDLKTITHTRESFLTEETKQIIYNFYREDFERFGYEP